MSNIITLQCFLLVAELLSFTKAAAALRLTRQAVSKQIMKLERELDTALFNRSTNSVELTEEGKIYKELFETILKEWEKTQVILHERQNEKPKSVIIGYPLGLNISELADEINRLCGEKGNEAHIRLEYHDPLELISKLVDGKLDFAITYDMSENHKVFGLIDSLAIAESNMLLVADKNHPLACEGARAESFSDEIFFTWTHTNESEGESVESLLKTCSAFVLNVKKVQVLPNLESVQTAVAMGEGVTICNEMSILARIPGIRAFPLGAKTSLIFSWRRNEKNPLLLSFITKAKQGAVFSARH